jgi:hypothetical protein
MVWGMYWARTSPLVGWQSMPVGQARRYAPHFAKSVLSMQIPVCLVGGLKSCDVGAVVATRQSPTNGADSRYAAWYGRLSASPRLLSPPAL